MSGVKQNENETKTLDLKTFLMINMTSVTKILRKCTDVTNSFKFILCQFC